MTRTGENTLLYRVLVKLNLKTALNTRGCLIKDSLFFIPRNINSLQWVLFNSRICIHLILRKQPLPFYISRWHIKN
jgi:hypothetical protein